MTAAGRWVAVRIRTRGGTLPEHARVRSGEAGCLAVAFCVAAPVYAQAQGRITGSVVDTTNTPLASVTITLTGPNERKAQSGPDGAFAFDALAEGEYRLEASLPGFARAAQSVRLTAGETSSVVLKLCGADLRQGRRHGRKVG